MPVNESLASVLDKAYEQKPLKQLVGLSPGILEGLSDKKAALLKDALGVDTIEELATNKFVLQAQALVTLARFEK